jgi:hypothetical protein
MTAIFSALLGTLFVFSFNAILAASFTGLGLLLRKAFGLKHATIEDCFTAFWMGFGLIIAFLMLWNFALPIGGGAPLIIVLVAGIAGMLGTRRSMTAAIWGSAPPRWSVICAVLFSLWVANLSLGQMTAWDSALYHMQGVKWASSYPVVAGVANVFGPIGFNNASLLYDAMFDAGPWRDHAWHVANGVLVSVFAAQLITSAARILKRTPPTGVAVFSLFLLPTAASAALDGVPNFMTVVPSSLVLMVTIILVYRAFTEAGRPDRDMAYDFFCMTFLAAIAVAIKTSAAIFASIILLISCYGIVRLGRDVNRVRTFVWMFTSVTVIGVAWVVRGIIMSGYPLFPSPVFGLPVDWRVPLEHARAEYDFVVHSATSSAENLAFVSRETVGLTAWMPRWIRTAFEHLYELVVPLGMVGVTLLFFLWSVRRATDADRESVRRGWIVLPLLLITLVGWFLVAPMPAYGAPFFWSLAALLGTQAYRLQPRDDAFRRRLMLAGCLFGLTPPLVDPIWSVLKYDRDKSVLATVVNTNIKVPTPGRWYQVTQPPTLTSYTTRTGVVLNVPIGRYGRCWYAPIPCTPNPAPNLRLRVPGKTEKGFTVDGDWQMRDWPEPWRPDLLPAMREGWRKLDASASAK